MKNIFKLSAMIAAVTAMFTLAACSTEELDTDQYSSKEVLLQAYGPQPVVRGGVLRFIGSNLDQVATVSIPGVTPITPEVVTAGTHSEIRITVPKDGPEVGYPVLTLNNGTTITGKTILSYSEPIIIETFSPAEALPGETVTIKGDYLNNIHEVIFADKVKVSEKNFAAHDRYAITVTVPETAQTGKIGLGTVDELAVEGTDDEAALLAVLNIIETETAFVVTTAQGNVAVTTLKSGETVTINGTNMNLVKSIVLNGATITDFTATATKITFDLPAAATDGDVVLVMASGVEVVAGTLTTVVPTGLAAAPAPVKNGKTLTISGTDLDLVTGVELPNAGYVEFKNDDNITFDVPEAAQAGDITLHLENGKTVTVAYTLVEPAVTDFSANPAAAGSDVTINGTDLDLVAAVTFGGDIKVDVEATETAITVAVPTAAETGVLVLNLKNGASLETVELKIDKPAGAYIANFPETLYKPGEMFIIDIENAEHLTGVQVNGEDVNYILNGSTLYFQIPDSAGANSTLTLVSDNGSVTYTMNIDPGDFIVTTIWSAGFDCSGWNGNQDLAWGGYDWSTVTPGTILRFNLEGTTTGWWCISLRHGNSWGALAGVPGQYDTPESPLDIVLTREILDDLVDNGGLVITGDGFHLSSVALVQDLRYGTTIWEGNSSIGEWGGNQDLAWGGFDWSTVSAGQTMFLHFNVDVEPGNWYCISLRHGDSWGALAGVPGQYDNPESPFGIKLTQEIIDDLVASNGLVVTGYMFTLTKISVK